MSVLRISNEKWKTLTNSINRNTQLINQQSPEVNAKLTTIPKEWLEYYDTKLKRESGDKHKGNKAKLNVLPKNKVAERDKFVLEKKKQIYLWHKPLYPSLQEAVHLSEVLFERAKQLEVNKIKMDGEQQLNKLFKKEIEAADRKDREQQKIVREKNIKSKMQLKAAQEKQISERRTNKEKERELLLKVDKEKWISLNARNAENKLNDIKTKQMKKEEIARGVQDLNRERNDLKNKIRKHEDENFILDKVYCEAKQLLQNLIENKKEEIQDDLIRRREASVKKLKESVAPVITDENEIELVQNFNEINNQFNKSGRTKEFKIESYKRSINEKEKRSKKRKEFEQWILARKQEQDGEPKREITIEEKNKIPMSKLVICKKEEVISPFEKQKWSKQDSTFLQQAQKIERYLTKINRPTFPIKKAVEKYKKENIPINNTEENVEGFK